MKRALVLTLVVAIVAATAIAVGAATASPAKKSDTSLSGAGSSFVFPLVSKWIPALGSAYGYNVSYAPIGSGGGIAAITAKTVDFGASDAPLSNDQASGMRRLRPDPVGAFCHVDHVQPAGRQLRPAADRSDPRQDLPRRDHDLERRGDHEDQPEVHAVEHEDHAGAPLGQLRHDVQLHRLPLDGQPGPGSRSWASASTRSGRPARARAAARVSRACSRRRRARSATPTSPTR